MITRRIILAAAFALTVATPALARERALVVFAAASLKNALDEAAADWSRETGRPAPKLSYAASNTLAKQIEQGAPADLFFSADTDWMAYLEEKKLIRPGSRVDLLGNRIALIAPKDSAVRLSLASGVDLRSALGRDGRLAMANVDAVPAGKYGRAALESLGAWAAVKDRVAQADNVRAALALVARGEAPLGIVYATDAAAEPAARMVDVFPENTHPPIIYPVAVTRESANPAAAAFLAHLRGAKARAIFESHGFTVPNRPWVG